ncbi:MAG: hypothetical protein RL186_1756, partial [Pseudomonadota bacterium]
VNGDGRRVAWIAPARIGHVTGLAGVTPLDRLMRAA